jgi:hypothetical protein
MRDYRACTACSVQVWSRHRHAGLCCACEIKRLKAKVTALEEELSRSACVLPHGPVHPLSSGVGLDSATVRRILPGE